jgi:uncharacterized membrane protein YeaQ/YmgE (transglycosylase-associated protein family)
MDEAGVGWIAAIVIGGLAGWLAEMFMKSNQGVLMNIILGIVGAVVANVLLGLIGVALGGWLGYLIAGFIGACILIAIGRAISQPAKVRCCRQRPSVKVATLDSGVQRGTHATPETISLGRWELLRRNPRHRRPVSRGRSVDAVEGA